MRRPLSFVERLARDARSRTETIYPWELPSIMRKHIVTGAMGTVYFALLSGFYLVTFGESIGMQYWQWALLSAVSSFVLVFQLGSAYLVSLIGTRKTLWFATALMARLLRGAAIAVAFWMYGISPSPARSLFLTLLIVANCFDAFCVPPWMSWLADIIPSDQHGQFMGRRTAWIARANLLVVVPIGFALDRMPEEVKIPVLMVVFALGFTLGIADLVIHRTIPEPQMALPPRRRFWREVAAPLKDTRFRPWLLFNAAWTFSMTLGGSLSMVYFVQDLEVRRNYLGGSVVLIVLPLVGNIVGAKFLGALVDRHGVRRMLRWGHGFWAILPLFWFLATPRTALWLLAASSLVGAVSSSTAMTASNKLITRLPPAGHVPMYVAVSACVGSLAGGFGPLLAGYVLQSLKGTTLDAGIFTLGPFHFLFLASFLLRGLSTLLIRRIREPAWAS